MIRRILKTLGWIAGAVLALAVVLYLTALVVNRHDAEPSAAATRLANLYRDRPAVADKDNGFVALATFDAMPVDRQKRDSAIQQFIDDCNPGKRACASAFETADAVFERWMTAEPELLDQYQQLIAHTGWREAVPEHLSTPLPKYALVIDGQRVLLLKSKRLVAGGDYAGAQTLLTNDTRFWRTMLESSDTLISKMIATAALYRHFELGNEVVRHVPAAQVTNTLPASWQTPLSDAERSMTRCMTGEWIYMSAIVPDTVQEHTLMPFFQRQDTLNHYAEWHEQIGAMLNVPLKQYGALTERSSRHVSEETAWPLSPYNIIGRILFTSGSTDYASYAVRVGDIEGVRRAALEAVTLRAAGVPASGVATALSNAQLRNPYNGQPFAWDEKEGAIVFRGLQPGERGEHRIRY
jgi:hypothetical protein